MAVIRVRVWAASFSVGLVAMAGLALPASASSWSEEGWGKTCGGMHRGKPVPLICFANTGLHPKQVGGGWVIDLGGDDEPRWDEPRWVDRRWSLDRDLLKDLAIPNTQSTSNWKYLSPELDALPTIPKLNWPGGGQSRLILGDINAAGGFRPGAQPNGAGVMGHLR